MTHALKLSYEHTVIHKFKVLVATASADQFKKYLDATMGQHTYTMRQESVASDNKLLQNGTFMTVLYLETTKKNGKKMKKAIENWGR